MKKVIRVSQISVPLAHTKEEIFQKACALAQIPMKKVQSMQIMKQSVDARKKDALSYTYTVQLVVGEHQKIRKNNAHVQELKPVVYQIPGRKELLSEKCEQMAVVGAGPAGLFAAYLLAQRGYCPHIYERGRAVEERQQDVEDFWNGGALDPESNVQFGEGGAGTFSDGKLNTLVKDKFGRSRYVLETFVKFGAAEDILYVAKPHVGTDVLRDVVKNIRNRIIAGGGEVHFRTEVTKILEENGRVTGVMTADGAVVETDHVILSVGHSARDLFAELDRMKVFMEPKPFAVGLRIQHPQAQINKNQYGMEDAGKLGAAPYKVTAKTTSGRGVYSFCMCPGGMVVNASSEKGHLAVNGMSNFKRDSGIANSALIVAITPADFPEAGPLGGIAFQRSLEERAFALGGGKIPVQLYGDFAANRPTVALGDVDPVFCGGFSFANLRELMPEALNGAFLEGMEQFGRRIKGFDRADAVLAGIESRTSSPLRICRDESLQSSLKGLYPCGEGAGYAGGITSAAMDGLKVAEEIIKRYAAAE